MGYPCQLTLPTTNKDTLVGAIREIFYSGGGGSGTGITLRVVDVTITPTIILNKGFSLLEEPTPSTVKIQIYGGPLQRQNVDYTITDSDIAWDSLGLELLLEAGDVIQVTYTA